MRSVQRSIVAIGVACVAVLIVVPAASAKPQRYRITVTPASPTLRQAVTITLTAPKLKPGTHYEASIDRVEGPQRVCAPVAEGVAMRRLADGRFTATLRPHWTSGDFPLAKVWCPGLATLRVERRGPWGLGTIGFAKRPI